MTEKKYPALQQATGVVNKLTSKGRCPEEFNALVNQLDALRKDFIKFQRTCEERSGLCAFLGEWLKIVAFIKNAVVSEREGNWDLHVAMVDDSQRVYTRMDSCHYLRYVNIISLAFFDKFIKSYTCNRWRSINHFL